MTDNRFEAGDDLERTGNAERNSAQRLAVR